MGLLNDYATSSIMWAYRLLELCHLRQKSFKTPLYSSSIRKVCWQTCNFNTLENGRQQRESSCSLVVVNKKRKSAFLFWHRHGDTKTDFQLNPANFLPWKPKFMFMCQITYDVEYAYKWRSKKSTYGYRIGFTNLHSFCAVH